MSSLKLTLCGLCEAGPWVPVEIFFADRPVCGSANHKYSCPQTKLWGHRGFMIKILFRKQTKHSDFSFELHPDYLWILAWLASLAAHYWVYVHTALIVYC